MNFTPATSLKVTHDPKTIITLNPTADSALLPLSQKIELAHGTSLQITEYQYDSSNNHYEVKLKTPQKGNSYWFAYKPHVDIT